MGTGVSDDDKKKSTDSYPPDHVARRHVGWPHAPARCSPPLGQFFCCVVWLGDHTGVDSVQHRVCLYIQDPPVWSVNESRAHVNFVNTKFQIERDRLAWTTIYVSFCLPWWPRTHSSPPYGVFGPRFINLKSWTQTQTFSMSFPSHLTCIRYAFLCFPSRFVPGILVCSSATPSPFQVCPDK